MTDNSTSGAGGTAAPGWYADPYDPRQLRWWSGQTWTEHVSPLQPPAEIEAAQLQQATEAVQQEARQPQAAEPERQEAVQTEAVQQEAVQPESEVASVVAPTPVVPDALPSRRALREASVEAEPAADRPVAAVPAEPEATWPQNAGTPDAFAAPAEPASEAPAADAPATDLPATDVPLQPTTASDPVQDAVHQPTQALRPEDFELAADQNRWNPSLSAGSTPAWGQPQFAQPDTADDQPVAAAGPDVTPDAATDAPASTEPAVESVTATPAAGAQPDTAATATDDWGLVPSGATEDAAPRPTTANTPWVWLIAISPLIAAILIGYSAATSTPSLTNVLFIVGIVAPYLLVVVFAVADRSRLVILGHPAAASWTWSALTAPVYLIARGGVIRRELGSAGPTLFVWLACFIVGVAGFALYGLLFGHALAAGLPVGNLFG